MQHYVCTQVNQWLNIRLCFACCIGVCSLCVPLFPWGKNLQPRLQKPLYNMHVDFNKPTILYQVVSQISISWIMINFWRFISPLVCNLLRMSNRMLYGCQRTNLITFISRGRSFHEKYVNSNSLSKNAKHSRYEKNSLDKSLSILEIEPSNSNLLHFFF